MTKIIQSPVKRWPGEVVLKDPIPLPDCLRFEQAINAAQTLEGESQIEHELALLPGVLACVEEFRLEGFTPDPWPGSPRTESARLLSWLIGEVLIVFQGEAVPLAS